MRDSIVARGTSYDLDEDDPIRLPMAHSALVAAARDMLRELEALEAWESDFDSKSTTSDLWGARDRLSDVLGAR